MQVVKTKYKKVVAGQQPRYFVEKKLYFSPKDEEAGDERNQTTLKKSYSRRGKYSASLDSNREKKFCGKQEHSVILDGKKGN